MPIEIPEVRLGEPDLRPAAARMVAGGAQVYPVEGHRSVRPSVEGALVSPRAGRVPWAAEPHRRRVRLGVDS